MSRDIPEQPSDAGAENRPKHQQIFDALKEEILAGKYDARRRLPSETQLVRRFGISRPTVSRALRDLKAAGFLDRRPGSGTYLNPTTRPGTGYFGMIVPSYGTAEIFAPICAEIALRSQQAGYTLLWGDSSATDLETRAHQAFELCQQYIRQKVAGVFLEPLELIAGHEAINHQILNTLTENRIPTVLIDRDIVCFPERSSYDLVGIDNLSAGYRIANHLLTQGATRITFVSRPGSAPTVQQRCAGVHDALLNAGIHWSPQQIARGDPDNLAFVRTLLGKSAKNRPDAFICANDDTAARLMVTLNALGLRVPRDIRLASFDDVQYAKLLSPPLTTMHQPCKEIGAVAVQTLLQRIREPNTPPREILLDAPLVVRQSCGAPRAKRVGLTP